ncbi:DUF1127 domain-containing protein [Poseidonocella sp. HB161398]|uniref:DUF1127 domain-containing protein n=1 Tax=Poseidonocella sp. HB161398 TaxID=2320855 RepID=UPI0011090C55|nr:DUF1127 domain-containing protein [Poseidonocella sp. HB161398]
MKIHILQSLAAGGVPARAAIRLGKLTGKTEMLIANALLEAVRRYRLARAHNRLLRDLPPHLLRDIGLLPDDRPQA